MSEYIVLDKILNPQLIRQYDYIYTLECIATAKRIVKRTDIGTWVIGDIVKL